VFFSQNKPKKLSLFLIDRIMSSKKATIKNDAGIHCRPASLILKAATEMNDHDFLVISNDVEVSLSSILSLISLGLQRGDSVEIKVEGPDAEIACDKMVDLFETEFDFPPREA
jgi:phosphocarrier protein HPr